MNSGSDVWHNVVAARNEAAAQARTLREEKRAAAVERAKAPTDIDILSRDFHTTSIEAREEKPMRGCAVPRALPNWAQDAINARPPGDPLRAARDRGDIKYDVRSGAWKVYGPGIATTPAKEATADHHFAPGFFTGTARRERERQAR